MARPKYPSDSAAQFMLRLPPGMRELIKRSAEESGRSMNAEIVDVLREYFPADPELDEVADALEQAASLLNSVIDGFTEDGEAPPASAAKALGIVQAANEDLYKVLGRERISPVAMLSKSAIEKVKEVAQAYEFQNETVESLISNLVVMGAEQVLRKEARLRVEIGEGESARVVELAFPEDAGREP